MQEALASGDFTPRAANAIEGFMGLFRAWSSLLQELDLSSLVASVLEESGLLLHYSEKGKEKAESKRENLMELVNAVEEFARQSSEPNLINFLTQAALEAGEWQAADHESYVHLMTLHAAKGLEFPLVFMVGMEEGIFPSQMSLDEPGRLEEERRLCYVGMTRSMNALFMTYAEVRRQYGREQYHRPSRFLAELPLDLLHAIRPKSQLNYSGPSAVAKPVDAASPFKVGQKVSHAHFGSGQVTALEGQGEQMRIQVRFQQYGAKWLVLAYAKLKALD
jgi:DNA helicase-2/ATP-dependent DNA helicase PcrA